MAFNVTIRQKLYPLQVGFRKYGESGIELSDWVPHMGSCIDDIAVGDHVLKLDGIVPMNIDYAATADRLERIMPLLKKWVDQR